MIMYAYYLCIYYYLYIIADETPEDAFVGLQIYNEFKVSVIHCGGKYT